MDMQALVDAIGAGARRTRSGYHLTLGGLIEALEHAPKSAVVTAGATHESGQHVGAFGSYRGYYADLAINPADKPQTAGALLTAAREALGQEFTGYKGGKFRMGEDTPLWFAPYGCCGEAIVGVHTGTAGVLLETREVDA